MPAKKETTTSTTKKVAASSTTKKTPIKTTATKKTTPTKTVAAKSTSVKKAVAANARHIEENARTIENNSKLIHILYGTIIVLMMIIAGLAFYVGTIYGKPSQNVAPANTTAVNQDIVVTIIDDSRCTTCQTDEITTQLKNTPFLAGAEFITQDFSDDGVSKFMQENNLSNIPTVLFSTNLLNDAGQITPYLQATPSGQFNLALPVSFNPFAKRSERGLEILEGDMLENVLADLHPERATWEEKIMWIEYSDLGCGACKQFHNSGIIEAAMEKYSESVSRASVGFLSVWWPTSLAAMKAIECMADQDAALHAAAWENFYKTGDYSAGSLETFASENGVNIDTYNSCKDSSEITTQLETQVWYGREYFGVTGTPGNIIINLETGEFVNAGWDIEPAIESLQ